MSDQGQPGAVPPPPGSAPPPPAAAPPPPASPASGFPPPPAVGSAPPPPPGAASPLAEAVTLEASAPRPANKLSAGLLLGGAVLLVVGSFLPWAGLDAEVVDFLDLDATASGWSTLDGEVGDGPIFLVLAIALAVFGILALRGVANLGTKIAAIVVAALALVFALAEFGSVASENDDFNALGLPGIEDPFTYEYGLFVLAAGAVIALVGAILQRRRPRTTPSPY